MLKPISAFCRSSLAIKSILVQGRSIHHVGLEGWQVKVVSRSPALANPYRYRPTTRSIFPAFASARPLTKQALFLSTTAEQIKAVDESESWPNFEEKSNLHPMSKKALKEMNITTMSEIQAKTFDQAASGRDVLARARTGTGKTLAFLLPAFERILQNPIEGQVNMLILCPTRELASQIADQTRKLTSAHRGISYQVMFGGSSRRRDIERLERRVPTILVSTPGRIQDHFDNTLVRNKRFSTLFHRTQLLVLDEMDRLLDMGFRNSVEQIITYLPLKRQTLLFSATLPPGVKHIIERNMQSDYCTVDCVHDSDPTTHTNELVQQSHVMIPQDKLVMATVGILLNILEDENAKMICFFPTTKMTKYYAELFNHGLGRTVMELHSGKTQAYRTSASNRFRELEKGVLFTSDVSARGVDYKNVSHVVQVGMADSRETYIHRLGRTARAGKKGEGILILSDIEQGFLRMLNGLDIPLDNEMQQLVDSPSASVLNELDPVLDSIRSGRNKSLQKSAQASHRGMMGYYRGQLKRIGVSSPQKLVRFVNEYSMQTGLSTVPSLSVKAARNMGLYGVAGVNYASEGTHGGPTTEREQGKASSSASRAKKQRSGKKAKKRASIGSKPGHRTEKNDWLGQNSTANGRGNDWSPW